jgi:Ca-activated chloride channel family protein
MKPTITCLAHTPAVCSDRLTTLQLLVRLDAPRAQRRGRPELNVGLAVDRSGSMSGEPMENARRAACHLVRRLEPGDHASVVSFSCTAEVQVPCRRVGDGTAIVQKIESLFASGNTALHQGWLEACQQAVKGASKRRLSRVILLSDGQANVGLLDPQRIAAQVAEWQRHGISTSTVGLGIGYNEDLLAAMARAGNGSFYHVARPGDIESTFHVELQSMLAAYGRAVSLGVETLSGVRLLRVLNPLPRTSRGRRKLSDLVSGHTIDVVMELEVPPMRGERDLLELRLAWTSVETGEREVMTHRLRLPVVPFGQLSEFPRCPEVMQKRAVQLSARVLKEAAKLIDKRDHEGARAALRAGLDALHEAGPAPDLQYPIEQLNRMLEGLNSGSYNEVRKQATFSSTSWSSSSMCLSGFVREWMALPEAERSPERLNELMQEFQRDSSAS